MSEQEKNNFHGFMRLAINIAKDLYIPTYETMDINNYKFLIRQETLKFIDVWENEYQEDAFSTDRDIQDDDWNIREKYRKMRTINAYIIMELIRDFIVVLTPIYKSNYALYKDLTSITPPFLDRVNVVVHKKYDLTQEPEKEDGKGLALMDVINDIVIKNVTNI